MALWCTAGCTAKNFWRMQTPPPPALPKEVVEATQNKYLEAYRILTGSELAL